MTLKSILKKIDVSIDKETEGKIKAETKRIVEKLKEGLKKNKYNADVFVGGSYAKGTLGKKEIYDVDIFVRFDWKYEELSERLEKVIKSVFKKDKIEKVHGSRDYYRIMLEKLIFEIVPVTKIKKPTEARNVTDLSYSHVNYVRRELMKNKKLINNINIAKKFFKAQKVYGAESYIQGFSGYALECLIINYGSFVKMLKELVKVKDRIILDPRKLYKRKEDVLFEINESKLHGPIILVDPTWKERNVLAALNKDVFKKFQEVLVGFLKKPSSDYFEEKNIDEKVLEKEAKKKKCEYVKVGLKTDRQEGDIAGTKLKKFSRFLIRQISKYYDIRKSEFEYVGGQLGNLYLIAKSKGEIVKTGPPVAMKEAVKSFKKENKGVYEKNNYLYVKIKVKYSLGEFIKNLKNSEKSRIKDMSVIRIDI